MRNDNLVRYAKIVNVKYKKTDNLEKKICNILVVHSMGRYANWDRIYSDIDFFLIFGALYPEIEEDLKVGIVNLQTGILKNVNE